MRPVITPAEAARLDRVSTEPVEVLALRAGAGLVGLMVPGACQWVVAGAAPELLTYGMGDGEDFEAAQVPACLKRASRFDVVVIGPGIGRADHTRLDGRGE